jgi:hypothetical protein
VIGDSIRVTLEWRIDRIDLNAVCENRSAYDTPLLHRVREFVREQMQAIALVGPVASMSEMNVLSERERVGRQQVSGAVAGCIIVDSHGREVDPVVRLELLAQTGVE